jgi:hypothetical protein
MRMIKQGRLLPRLDYSHVWTGPVVQGKNW